MTKAAAVAWLESQDWVDAIIADDNVQPAPKPDGYMWKRMNIRCIDPAGGAVPVYRYMNFDYYIYDEGGGQETIGLKDRIPSNPFV